MIKVEVSGKYCKACGYCISVCPKKVLGFGDQINEMGYAFAQVLHPQECIGCLSCATICPDAAICVTKEE